MDDLPKETAASEKRPVNWYWVGSLLFLALLGAFLDSKLSSENVRFIGNPLTCVCVWGAVLCLLFKKDRAKPGHPHQAGMMLAIDARVIVFFLFIFWHSISLIGYDFSAQANLRVGTIVFLVVLSFRPEYRITRGVQSLFGKRCRICDTLLVYYYDRSITNDPKRPIASYCFNCGTNCEGPIEQPLTPTAREFLDGNKANLGCGGTFMERANLPPHPVPFPWGKYFKGLLKVIGILVLTIFVSPFAVIFLSSGPYLAIKWILVLAVLTLIAFAIRAVTKTLKAHCPHCQTDLFAFRNELGILRRNLRYRFRQGRFEVGVERRYCPYCGKDIETPPNPVTTEVTAGTPPESPAESSDAIRNTRPH